MMTSLNNSPVTVGLGMWVYDWGRGNKTDVVMAANAENVAALLLFVYECKE